VLQPGDTAVDATCGNGHDTLALAELVGPRGVVWGLDLQVREGLGRGRRLAFAVARAAWTLAVLWPASAGADSRAPPTPASPAAAAASPTPQDQALASTRARLDASLPPGGAPELHLVRACHSRLQELVGSCVARVVAFNLGYLPSGDKGLTTQAETTVAALEAAIEVRRRRWLRGRGACGRARAPQRRCAVRLRSASRPLPYAARRPQHPLSPPQVLQPGGLLTVMAYTGHPGGKEEYDAVMALLAELSPAYFVTSEVKLVNRPTAPILLLAWRRSDAAAVLPHDARRSGGGRGGGRGASR
jgi:hypothetical protein